LRVSKSEQVGSWWLRDLGSSGKIRRLLVLVHKWLLSRLHTLGQTWALIRGKIIVGETWIIPRAWLDRNQSRGANPQADLGSSY